MPDCALSVSPPKKRAKPADSSVRKLLWPTVIVLAVAAADQLSKVWAVSFLSGKLSVEVLGRFFILTLVYNRGGALGTSFGSSTYYLISSIAILCFVVYYIYVSRGTTRITYPLAFTAGGAVGNIIDRIRLGHVIDFLDVDFFNINIFGYRIDRWWTFNLADAAISCSILFLVISLLVDRRRRRPPSQPVETI
jgi:signal peptidase II